MTNALQKTSQPPVDLAQLVVENDYSGLTKDQKAQWVLSMCERMGISALSQPIQFLNLQGREVPYAKKDCTDQLRAVHKLSCKIVSREVVRGLYVVTVEVSSPDGRTDSDMGAVPVAKLADGSDALANAMMKATTKAKRRATLSFCGLGILDESEVETIPGARLPKEEKPAGGLLAAELEKRANRPAPQTVEIDPVPQDEFKAYDMAQWVRNIMAAANLEELCEVRDQFKLAGCTAEDSDDVVNAFRVRQRQLKEVK